MPGHFYTAISFNFGINKNIQDQGGWLNPASILKELTNAAT